MTKILDYKTSGHGEIRSALRDTGMVVVLTDGSRRQKQGARGRILSLAKEGIPARCLTTDDTVVGYVE